MGYWFGSRAGPHIFKREDSLFFHKDNLVRARKFYEKHGGKTVVLARFLPIVRTFAPIVAGAGKMRYATFLFYNVTGGFAWAVGVTLAGYFLGQSIPDIDKYLLPIIIGIILLSLAPTAFHLLKDRPTRRELGRGIKRIFQKNRQAASNIAPVKEKNPVRVVEFEEDRRR